MIDWGAVALYAVCALTCAINYITLRRAQAVEDSLKEMLTEYKASENGGK